MEKHQYITLKENTAQEIEKIKGSRFIGRAFKASSKQEAEDILDRIRKKFYNATHNCFAYIIRSDQGPDIFRYSDDGEPSGTAGRPIYNALSSSGLVNTVVIVTRYYGGTNLGTGGLAKAYSAAAKLVLRSCIRELVELKESLKFSYIYDHTSLVMNIISKYEASVLEENYGSSAEMTISVNRGFTGHIIQEMFERSNGAVSMEKCS